MDVFAILAEGGAAATPVIDWTQYITSATFQPLIDGILSLFPIVVATVIPLLVLRKGWQFLLGNIYSA